MKILFYVIAFLQIYVAVKILHLMKVIMKSLVLNIEGEIVCCMTCLWGIFTYINMAYIFVSYHVTHFYIPGIVNLVLVILWFVKYKDDYKKRLVSIISIFVGLISFVLFFC